MGPGIFTTHWRKVLGGCAAVFLLISAVLLYSEFRSPVGGISPHAEVNDLYEWECMTFHALQDVYSADAEEIELYFRNDAPDGVVCLASTGTSFAYELEIFHNGAWHRMRPQRKHPRWDARTDIVNWAGGELVLSCPVAKDYGSPLPVGQYRIVIPNCEHISRVTVALAAEFEVLP